MPPVKQDAVQEIKDRLDLVDLVSEHLRLQKAGRDLKGLCPFHQEKTPSLYVSPEKQLWHCYGCQKGGDHFTFIQDIEHVDFKGALRLLADKTGVVLEESPGAGRQRELKRTIQRLNLLAAQYFHHILLENPAGQRALIQLESRGVTRASMTEFQLGFAPAGQHKDNLVRFLRKHGVSEGELLEAGLAISPHPALPQGGRDESRGELWDRFRQRIMIPIHDEHGELVAFGGRVIDDTNQPKYLNTSQTALYDKGRTLFNLHRARKSIHEMKHAVLMEGYFDAITAWQANVTNVVTTSGTALSEHQVRLLKRETQELVLAFDRDDAGLNATQRAIELASKSGIYIKVVRVPQGKDPDDYLRANPDGWANLREHALPEWEYLLRQALGSLDLTDAGERRRAAELVIPVLAKIPEASVLEIYAQQAAGWLRIEPAALLRDVQALKSGRNPHPGPPPNGERNRPRNEAYAATLAAPGGAGTVAASGQAFQKDEGYLLGLLIERPDLVAEVAGELREVNFSSPAYEQVFARLQQMVEGDATARPTDRLSEFTPDEQGLISAVAMTRYPELDSGSEAALRQSLEQCLQTLKINASQRRLKALVAEMRAVRASGDESRLVSLMQENDRLARELDALKAVRYGSG
ncbi:MAG TPA: DNA primase [Candidatus Dormibacteraeota bacterium]|nr:DNA primase [Candidatus Dormibacteraeota bacterium]